MSPNLHRNRLREKKKSEPVGSDFCGGDEGDRTPYLLNAILPCMLVQMSSGSKSAETSHFREASSPRFQYRTSSFNTYSLRRLDGQIFRHLWYKSPIPIMLRRRLFKPKSALQFILRCTKISMYLWCFYRFSSHHSIFKLIYKKGGCLWRFSVQLLYHHCDEN